MGRSHAGANGCVLIKLMGSHSWWQWRVIGAAIVAVERHDAIQICSYVFVIVLYCSNFSSRCLKKGEKHIIISRETLIVK